MAQEIERKFLVRGEYKQYAHQENRIVQSYLCSVPERIVRIRLKGEQGYITIKGIGNTSGISRYEWEKEISSQEAQELLKLCEPGMIDKTRSLIKNGDFTFEVDEFHGDNQGLIVAEIELHSEDDRFDKPEWLGEEVTGDVRYYNSHLMKEPYNTWGK